MDTTQPGGEDWGFNATDPRVVVYAGGVPLLRRRDARRRARRERRDGEQDEECVIAAATGAGFAIE